MYLLSVGKMAAVVSNLVALLMYLKGVGKRAAVVRNWATLSMCL